MRTVVRRVAGRFASFIAPSSDKNFSDRRRERREHIISCANVGRYTRFRNGILDAGVLLQVDAGAGLILVQFPASSPGDSLVTEHLL
jgi:hypothetical protein